MMATLPLTVGATTTSTTWVSPNMMELPALVVERNAIGDQVALSKWYSGKAVEDAQREKEVIDEVRRQAPTYGLNPDDAERFFAAQIESNKLVQYALLSVWQLQGRAPDLPPPDLARLRKQLDDLQKRLLQALASSKEVPDSPYCKAAIAQAVDEAAHNDRLDGLHHLALMRSFGDFCRATARP
ncbi:chorismate mutase [Dyella choica]|uniref:Chorismate mutase n=2 Tax=Dyella choica TaxID=1927959 RepID=A0A432MA86_9GAMM|nr:chorismate mutase [Dyella choica]